MRIILLLLAIFVNQSLFGQDTTVVLQLGKLPEFTEKASLYFPSLAQDAGLQGTIMIEALIDKNGIPRKTKIISRIPEFVNIFDETAREFIMKSKFSPGLTDKGVAVDCRMNIPISFRLRNFTPPKLIELAPIEIPKRAKELGLEGWVGCGVLIKKDGNPDYRKIIILNREPYSTDIFDDAAREDIKNSKFKSAEQDGNPEFGWVFVKIEFKI